MHYNVLHCGRLYLDANIDPLSEQLTLRLTARDISRLKTLRKRIPIASHNAIAREAFRLGIEALERDPGNLLRSDSDEQATGSSSGVT